MKTVVVIPAYNESTRLVPVVTGASQYCDTVIVVDDGSSDDTAAVARQAGATVVRHSINCGAGAATMTGIDAGRLLGADILVTIDADGQHDPAAIPGLIAPLKADEADLVIGNRFGQKNSIPALRRLFNMIGNFVTFAFTGRFIEDSQSGFKAFGPKALKQVELRMSGFEFCTEIVRESAQHNWRIRMEPISVIYNEYSMAKGQSLASGVKTFAKILIRSFLR